MSDLFLTFIEFSMQTHFFKKNYYHDFSLYCYSIDTPACKNDKPVIVGVSKGERVSIKCELDADPEDVTFQWHLAASGQMMPLPSSRYTNKGATSIIHYSPTSNLDYGSLFCRGTNSVGSQMTAQSCVFQVVAAGKSAKICRTQRTRHLLKSPVNV